MALKQKNIPGLTEIYEATEQQALTPVFFEFAMAQLKPLLEDALAEAALKHQNTEIKQAILDELRPALNQELQQQINDSLQQSQQSLVREMGDFLDKTKADLATEIPQIYQARAEIFQAEMTDQLAQLQVQTIASLRAEFEQLMPQLENR